MLDHFGRPLNRTRPRRGFHGAWAAGIARRLNHGVLSAGCCAVPMIDRDGPVEIDVAALRDPGTPGTEDATQPWAPPAPAWTVAVDFAAPLDLEASYQATCGDLRIRQAG